MLLVSFVISGDVSLGYLGGLVLVPLASALIDLRGPPSLFFFGRKAGLILGSFFYLMFGTFVYRISVLWWFVYERFGVLGHRRLGA